MNYQRSIHIVKTNQNGKEKEVVEETIQQNGQKWTRKIIKTPQHTKTYQDVQPVSSTLSSHQMLPENKPLILSLLSRGRMPTLGPDSGSELELEPSFFFDKTRRRHRRKRKTQRKKTSAKKNTRKGKGV